MGYYRFEIVSDSKSYHYTNDSLEAAQYILDIRSNFAYVNYAGYCTRTVSNNTHQSIREAIAYRDVKWLSNALEKGYKEVMAGGVY